MNKQALTQLIRSTIKEVLADFSASDLQACLVVDQCVSDCIDYQGKVLTQKQLNQLASDGCTRIRLAKKVVITPLAKDRLRQLNINLERV